MADAAAIRSRIFISYRRQESEYAVGRLADDLRKHFRDEQVSQDIASIAPGVDFGEAVQQALETCAAVLVVIGPRWVTVEDRKGRRRLDLPGDWVAREVAESLKRREVRVFPVLLDAEMPSADDLPEPLQPLTRRQAFPLTARHWRNDVEDLIRFLKKVPGLAPATAPVAKPAAERHEATEPRLPEPKAQPQAPRQAPAGPAHLAPGTEAAYRFTVVTVDERGKERERREADARSFAEDLGGGVWIDMTYVPAGRFLMGSPKGEADRADSEGPPHEVSVGPFYLGRHPVTQGQWRAVAGLPKVERDLNLEPSGFKGDDRPVERVSWHDAVEFCRRLSRASGREYRLPSEAEWEYACRAGTATPFHFGPTITPELVNYDGNHPYGSAPKGKYRGKTTPVGSLGVANAFGLFDMHGNVWEWCQDVWHENYDGAPSDGSAWEKGGDAVRRVVRGGSWFHLGWYCRSAFRLRLEPEYWLHTVGFRVVCSVSRTQ